MANVIFAAKQTTTDVLTTVSTATSAISAVTEIAALYATDYRDQVKQDLSVFGSNPISAKEAFGVTSCAVASMMSAGSVWRGLV